MNHPKDSFYKENRKFIPNIITLIPQLINVATLPCKIKRSSSRHTTTPKRHKIPQNNRSLLVHNCCWVVYSSSRTWYKSYYAS